MSIEEKAQIIFDDINKASDKDHQKEIDILADEFSRLLNEIRYHKKAIKDNKKYIKFVESAIRYHIECDEFAESEKINSLVNFCNTGRFLYER